MTGGSIDGGGGGRGRGRDLLSADALRRAKENLEHQSAAIDSLTQAEREGEGERERRGRDKEREREREESLELQGTVIDSRAPRAALCLAHVLGCRRLVFPFDCRRSY